MTYISIARGRVWSAANNAPVFNQIHDIRTSCHQLRLLGFPPSRSATFFRSLNGAWLSPSAFSASKLVSKILRDSAFAFDKGFRIPISIQGHDNDPAFPRR